MAPVAPCSRSLNMTDERDLSQTEDEALRLARRDIDAPPGVEGRVLAELRRQGLVGSANRARRWIAVAAAVLIGFGAGAWWQYPPRQAATISSRRFMLLLYGGRLNDRSDVRRVEYATWARSLSAGGVTIDGE